MKLEAISTNFARCLAPRLIAMGSLALLATPALATDAASQTPVAELDHMRQHMAPASSFYLEFAQKRRLKLFDEPFKSEGTMPMERTGEMRRVLGQPAEETILRSANRA